MIVSGASPGETKMLAAVRENGDFLGAGKNGPGKNGPGKNGPGKNGPEKTVRWKKTVLSLMVCAVIRVRLTSYHLLQPTTKPLLSRYFWLEVAEGGSSPICHF